MKYQKYISVFKINFLESIAYLGDVFLQSMASGIYVFIFIYLWTIIFEQNPNFLGFTLVAMLWYFGMAQAIRTFGGRPVKEISALIQKGDIINSLNKPYNFIIYNLFESLGKTFLRFFASLFWVSLLLLFYVGLPPLVFKMYPIVFIVILLGIIVNYLIGFSIATIAFWVEDATPYHWIYDKLLFILGGLLFPLELLPEFLRNIALNLPTSYLLYYPAKLFVQFTWELFWQVLFFQIIFLIAFYGLSLILFRIGIKKVSINGG